MSFPKLMARIAGQGILADPGMSKIWHDYVRTGDYSLLTAACGGGSGMPIPDTREAVLFNSLVYQNAHVEALAEVLSQLTGEQRGRWLVVDFGAGPGTGFLALGTMLRQQLGTPVSLSYVHIDLSHHMERLARAFFEKCDDVQNGRFFTVRDLMDVTEAMRKDWLDDCEHVLFIFSYVLCQSGVNEATLTSFAQAVVHIAQLARGRGMDCHLAMTDANIPRSRYPDLKRKLDAVGLRAPASMACRYPVIYLNIDGSWRDQTSRWGDNLLYAIGLLT